MTGGSAADRSGAPCASLAEPVQWATLPRSASVSGCPAPRTSLVTRSARGRTRRRQVSPCTLPVAAGHADVVPKTRAAWRRASSAASPGLSMKVPGWAAVHCCAVAGLVNCQTEQRVPRAPSAQAGSGSTEPVRHTCQGQAPEPGDLVVLVPEHRGPGLQRCRGLRRGDLGCGRRGGDTDWLTGRQHPEHGCGQALLVLVRAGPCCGERRVDLIQGKGGLCSHGRTLP